MHQEASGFKYDSYQESGIDWVGKVPLGWDLLPIRAIFHERREKNIGPKTDFILSVMKDRGVIPYDEKGNVGNKKSEKIENYKVVYPGDLVINKMNAIIGSLGISNYHGALSQVYIILYPRDYDRNDHRYLGYLFKVKPFQASLIKIGKGIMELRESIEFDEFKKILLPQPPLLEQQRIANFLGQKTAEIDTAIAKKQRLIELLKEQKAILINQAVTKGLNPDVPMRDSGVEWIGGVPEQWGTKKAKYLFSQSRLPVRTNDEVVTAYRDGQVTLRSNRRTGGYTFAILEQGYQGIRKGQLVLNSMDAFAGAIGVSDSDGKCSPEYVICNPTNPNEVDPMYYALLLREMALAGYIEVICSAVRQRALRIRYSNLAPLIFPVPPIEEQLQIVKKVDAIKSQVNLILAKLAEEVNAINEYKSVLIANVVTGKIKI
jgi:type I restriction enzyme S subunit